ncbi:hypothetical protein GOP47_0011408 [Adiantum capillus-veneris]|uniref:Uncharacterized protein n=1 Tax=Adiantum capillus-veneris TaxID=13818 RepID=A0A9D4USR1_ADICA|nr:hypothetical protein GOP47_0011408 [Adiantum capillus-veneris]
MLNSRSFFFIYLVLSLSTSSLIPQINGCQVACLLLLRSNQECWQGKALIHRPYQIVCQEHHAQRSNAATLTRRSLIILTNTALLGASLHLAPAAALAADGKPKYFTNLEEAREEGERRREQKERAEGPIVTLPSGVKFRELHPGSDETVSIGQLCSVSYTIYKLNG